MARRQLVTFEGWDGKWWTRIKVGKAVYSAVGWVLPWKLSLALNAAEAAGGYVGGLIRLSRQARR
jgi:hypothetical protein